MNLCGRCADRVRERKIVRKISVGENVRGTCDVCRLQRFVSAYEIEPKREERERERGNVSV